MKILLVEDDVDFGNGLRIALASHDFEVVWVRRRADALRVLDSVPCDLMLLDLGLPDGDGLDLLRHVRRECTALPVLILTARDAVEDRVRGLDGGGDDYLVKPFALAELLSRVRALMRRSYGSDGQTIRLGELALHEASRRVSLGGRPIELSRSEYELLSVLLKRAGRIVPRHALETQALPGQAGTESNALNVHLSNLRRKIGAGYIRNVRGVGYIIDRVDGA